MINIENKIPDIGTDDNKMIIWEWNKFRFINSSAYRNAPIP